jgi:hypothetical protein
VHTRWEELRDTLVRVCPPTLDQAHSHSGGHTGCEHIHPRGRTEAR